MKAVLTKKTRAEQYCECCETIIPIGSRAYNCNGKLLGYGIGGYHYYLCEPCFVRLKAAEAEVDMDRTSQPADKAWMEKEADYIAAGGHQISDSQDGNAL